MTLWNRILGRPGLGCLPDPEDSRDRPLGVLLGALADSPPPASASVRSPLVGPKNQAGTNSCTGMGASQGLREAFLFRGVECPELSALFPYFLGRAEFGGERSDAGSYCRTTLKAVMRFGCAAESVWPFGAGKVNRQPSWGAFRSGHDLKGMRGYYRITGGDVDGVRRAIADGRPVVGGWEVDRAFTETSGPLVIGGALGPVIGSHAVVIDGYGGDGTFDLLNSWGSSWRNNGRAFVTEEFIARGRDLWAISV